MYSGEVTIVAPVVGLEVEVGSAVVGFVISTGVVISILKTRSK